LPAGCSGVAEGTILPAISQLCKNDINLKTRIYTQQSAAVTYQPPQITLKQDNDDTLITQITEVFNDTVLRNHHISLETMQAMLSIARTNFYDHLPAGSPYHYASWFVQGLIIAVVMIVLIKKCFPTLFIRRNRNQSWYRRAPRREETRVFFNADRNPPQVHTTNEDTEGHQRHNQDANYNGHPGPQPMSDSPAYLEMEPLTSPVNQVNQPPSFPQHQASHKPPTHSPSNPANRRPYAFPPKLSTPQRSDSERSQEDSRSHMQVEYAKIQGCSSTEPESLDSETSNTLDTRKANPLPQPVESDTL